MGINVHPGSRAGEFIRSYVSAQRGRQHSASLATAAISERLFDGLGACLRSHRPSCHLRIVRLSLVSLRSSSCADSSSWSLAANPP